MQSVSLDTTDAQELENTYPAVIRYLATHTKYGSRTLDLSEVNCWMCEKPLRNSMFLCATNNEGMLRVVSLPELQAEGEDMVVNEEPDSTVFVSMENVSLIHDLILVCGDCCQGLVNSLRAIDLSEIKDPENPSQLSQTPSHVSNFILPNNANIKSSFIENDDGYSSNQCFIYVKKSALVSQMIQYEFFDENQEEMQVEDRISETLESHVFIEPSPNIPPDIYIRAQNTIKLFQLNTWYSKIVENIHLVKYPEGKTPYDDLRLIGRMQAYKQARKALKQIKMMRASYADLAYIDALMQQHQILLELTGYISTWRSVFNDGNDPDSFTTLTGVPVPPTNPIDNIENIDEETITQVNDSDTESVLQTFEDSLSEAETDIEFGYGYGYGYKRHRSSSFEFFSIKSVTDLCDKLSRLIQEKSDKYLTKQLKLLNSSELKNEDEFLEILTSLEEYIKNKGYDSKRVKIVIDKFYSNWTTKYSFKRIKI